MGVYPAAYRLTCTDGGLQSEKINNCRVKQSKYWLLRVFAAAGTAGPLKQKLIMLGTEVQILVVACFRRRPDGQPPKTKTRNKN